VSRESDVREAQARVAARYREAAARNGVELTHDQARERVAEAQRVGDRKRDNDNR